MKICFIGIGSIAKRHIKNLYTLLSRDNLLIDAVRHNTHISTSSDFNMIYHHVKDIPNDYDIIFITNPTSMHVSTLLDTINKSKAFFIEKPLRCMNQDTFPLNLIDNSKIYYVACPLRYTAIIQFLKINIKWEDVYSIRCISSSYLPEWRKGSDYRKSYSARKELGGGVASDLIHEWDYLVYLLGHPTHISKIGKKVSLLDINTEDIAIYIAEYPTKVVEVHLDYFGRSSIRQMELFTNDSTIICDFIKNTIHNITTNEIIHFSENRDDFQLAELKHFLDILNGKIKNDNTISDAETLLKILEA